LGIEQKSRKEESAHIMRRERIS